MALRTFKSYHFGFMLVLIIFMKTAAQVLSEFMYQAGRHCRNGCRNISCLNYNQSSKLRRTNIHMQNTESFFIAHRLHFAQNTQLWNVHFHLKTVHIAVHMNQNASALFILYRRLKHESNSFIPVSTGMIQRLAENKTQTQSLWSAEVRVKAFIPKQTSLR